MKRVKIITIINIVLLLLSCQLVSATTFLQQTLNELDRKADYIVIGTVIGQQSSKQETKIVTDTTIAVDDVLKGENEDLTKMVVKESGGIVGDIMMVVPGSPRFEKGEQVALFVDEDKVTKGTVEGHTVGMAQGKFSIQNEKEEQVLINELGGANLLTEKVQEKITLKEFKARYKKNIIITLFEKIKQFLWVLWN